MFVKMQIRYRLRFSFIPQYGSTYAVPELKIIKTPFFFKFNQLRENLHNSRELQFYQKLSRSFLKTGLI